CADDHDRGGNDVTVEFFGMRTNLHAVWDSEIIAKGAMTEVDYARHLNLRLRSQDLASLLAGTPQQWAEGSHRAAVQHAYKMPADRVLDAAYYEENAPIVSHQLAKAGVRLSRI